MHLGTLFVEVSVCIGIFFMSKKNSAWIWHSVLEFKLLGAHTCINIVNLARYIASVTNMICFCFAQAVKLHLTQKTEPTRQSLCLQQRIDESAIKKEGVFHRPCVLTRPVQIRILLWRLPELKRRLTSLCYDHLKRNSWVNNAQKKASWFHIVTKPLFQYFSSLKE